MKRIVIVVLVLSMVFVLVGCNSAPVQEDSAEHSTEESVEDKVKSRVEVAIMTDAVFASIGDNEIKQHTCNITNMEEISDTEYIVNGTVTNIDVYGTRWNNKFDCTVEKSSYNDSWDVQGDVEYKSEYWSKE